MLQQSLHLSPTHHGRVSPSRSSIGGLVLSYEISSGKLHLPFMRYLFGSPDVAVARAGCAW